MNNFPHRILCLPRNHFCSFLPTHWICSFCKTAREKSCRSRRRQKLHCVNNFPLRILCLPGNHFSSILTTHIGFVHLVKLRNILFHLETSWRPLGQAGWSKFPSLTKKKAPLIVKCRICTDLLKSSLKMTFKPCV